MESLFGVWKHHTYTKKNLPIFASDHLERRMINSAPRGDGEEKSSLMSLMNTQFIAGWGAQSRTIERRAPRPKKKGEPESTWADALDVKKKANVCGSDETSTGLPCQTHFNASCTNVPKRCKRHCPGCKIHPHKDAKAQGNKGKGTGEKL